MTTVPFMSTDAIALRMASTARPSAPILSPRPWRGAAARAPASVTLSSSRARFRSISWSIISPPTTWRRVAYPESLAGAAATDRELVSFDPYVLLAGQAAIPGEVHVHAGALEHGRDPNLDPVKGGLKGVDEHLIFLERNVAQGSRPDPPLLGGSFRRTHPRTSLPCPLGWEGSSRPPERCARW